MRRLRTFIVLCALLPACEDPSLRAVQSEVPRAERTRVVFGGDLEFGDAYMDWEVEAGRENVLAAHGRAWGLEKLAPLLRDADAVVVNLETPLTDIAESPWAGKKYYIHYNDPVETPAVMAQHNVTAAGLANNHILDFGVPGLEQTFAVLAGAGIAWFGAGMNERAAAEPFRYRAVAGDDTVTVLVAAGFEYAPWYDRAFHFFARDDTAGANNWTIDRAAADIARLRAGNPDAFIIAFPHWGKNYWQRLPRQRRMAKAIIDAGADLILGHGAHMMQEVEWYRGRWIVYSLGNLHFNAGGRYAQFGKPPYSLVAALDVSAAAGKPSVRLRLYPTVTNNLLTAFQPRPVTPEECDEVEGLLLQQTAVPRLLREHMRRGRDEFGAYFEVDAGKPEETM